MIVKERMVAKEDSTFPIPEDAEIIIAKDRKVAIIYRMMPKDLDKKFRGVTIKENGVYTVIINQNLPAFVRMHTLGHELAHIFCGHFEVEDPNVPLQEIEANHLAWDYYVAYKKGTLCL